ncbi:hypothetical protein [Nocardiopsis coralliicola]
MAPGALYPDPPHLDVAAYPDGDEAACFAHLCRVADALGLVPNGTVLTAPWELPFAMVSDLSGRTGTLELSGSGLTRMLDGAESARPVRAGFAAQRTGTAVVEYRPAPPGGKHPISLALAAGPLGMPPECWDRRDRTAARSLASLATSALRTATEQAPYSYGGISVEASLPAPSELASGEAQLPTSVYLSQRVLGLAPDLAGAAEAEYGCAAATWPNGAFFSAWDVFNPAGSATGQSTDRTSTALGRLLA